MRAFFRHTITVFALLTSNLLVAEEPSPGSLQSLFDEAQQLTSDPATQEKALEKLEALAASHRTNRKLYDRALTQLFRRYIQEGRGEQAARLAAKTLEYESVRIEQLVKGPLQRVLEETRRKFPEDFAKIAAEDKQSSSVQYVLNPNAGEADLTQSILQRTDKQLREKSLAVLCEQLTADAGAQQQTSALMILSGALPAKFDREPFRQLVLQLLKSDDAKVRYMAVSCLPGVSANRDDLAALLPLVEDPSPQVRSQLARALIRLGQGEAVDQVAPALVKLLRDESEDVIHSSIRSMWGQYRTPELNEVLIELSNHPQHHHVTIYHGLSTQQQKSVAVCQRLVEELNDPDWNNSGRAAWGLTYGVVPEAAAIVESGLLDALPEELNGYTREQEFRALRNVATEKSRNYLVQVAESDEETDEFRAQAKLILADLDAKR